MLSVIDAGHEGVSKDKTQILDCGAVGKYSKECDITLKFAKLLGEKLKAKGRKVIYTREGNLKQTTYQKAEIANKAKADRFISIHCNSYDDPNSNGVETYVCKGIKGETLELAKNVQAALVKSSGLKDRGVKEANYDVLVKTSMPAILIELGFISNQIEERLLNDDVWLDKVATAICNAIVDEKGVDENMDKPYHMIPFDKIEKVDIINVKGGITAKEVMKKYNPDWLCNLALYDNETKQNITWIEDENKASGYLFANDGIGIIGDNKFVWCTKDEAYKRNDIRDYVSGSPNIIENGKKVKDWGNKYSDYVDKSHVRMSIGMTDKELVLLASRYENTLDGLANYVLKEIPDIKYAINCDGGGSVHLQNNDKVYRASSRANCSWLMVWLKDEVTKPPKGDETILKQKVKIDGIIYETDAKILEGSTYIKLRDFSKAGYRIDYVDGIPIIDKPNK